MNFKEYRFTQNTPPPLKKEGKTLIKNKNTFDNSGKILRSLFYHSIYNLQVKFQHSRQKLTFIALIFL